MLRSVEVKYILKCDGNMTKTTPHFSVSVDNNSNSLKRVGGRGAEEHRHRAGAADTAQQTNTATLSIEQTQTQAMQRTPARLVTTAGQ